MSCGFENIPNEELTVEYIPTPDMNWWEISEFALTFDGYGYRGKNCGEFANETLEAWRKTGQIPDSLSELRCCLFFEQRRYHHFGDSPEGKDLDYVKSLLSAIREKVRREELNG